PPEFPSGFPRPLRPIVERCLRLAPEDRFASVHELLSAMGQTARQGDSVRFDWNAPEPAAASTGRSSGPSATTQATSAAGGESSRAAKEELRTAAAEFARGAVGVARGVWDGVVERVGGASSDGAAGEKRAADGNGSDDAGSEVLVIHSLEDPDEAALAPAIPGTFASHDAPWRQELRRARESGTPSAPAASGPSMLATVPVPPRAEGRFLGSVVQSVVVGAEIMGAVVTGPVMVFARGAARSFDRAARGLPGVLGALLRLLLFLVLMSVIGAVCAFVLLAAVAMNA